MDDKALSTLKTPSPHPEQRPKAYSYIRFSTPEQAHGDSLRRQTEAARAYAARHDLDFDETLDLTDPGISAHYGKNVEVGKLRAFLDGVHDNIIPQGSYLLVESLDRISRQTVRKAVRTMEEIVEAGITLVDLSDGGKRYSVETLDNDQGFSFIMMALRFVRAHEESAMKSRRLLAAYENKRTQATRKDAGAPFTRMLPAWLEWREGAKEIAAIPKRAAVIQSIFQKASEGWGQHRIAQWLNQQDVPTWGGRGNQRKAEQWHRSYVKKLLTNSAVVGTFTPHQKRTNASGKRTRRPLDPVEGYFPIVVDHELFQRVASRIGAAAPRGRNATREPASIFAGVLKCACCGGAVTRVSKGKHVYLVCSRANRKGTKHGCKYLAVRYEDVEEALTANAKVIIEEAPRGLETDELETELANLDVVVGVIADQARDLTDELVREKSGALRRRLREKETELEAAQERLRALRAQRDALAQPYVQRRLAALEGALVHVPRSVAEVNRALKEAVSKIILDPEEGRLAIYWHHASEPTDDVPFFSRHFRGFEDDAGEVQP
jgi:DNA invertase Pin-like site-specific DNA recombinase